MPFNDPEPEDPQMLVGAIVPGDEHSLREMAAAIADEFASMGWDERRLMALFRSPFYAGAHQALELLGDDAVLNLVRESVAFWSHLKVSVETAPCDGESVAARDDRELFVLEEDPCRKY